MNIELLVEMLLSTDVDNLLLGKAFYENHADSETKQIIIPKLIPELNRFRDTGMWRVSTAYKDKIYRTLAVGGHRYNNPDKVYIDLSKYELLEENELGDAKYFANNFHFDRDRLFVYLDTY